MVERYHGRVGSDSHHPGDDGWGESLFGPPAWAPLAAAWRAFHEGQRDVVLTVRIEGGEVQRMPVALFFRYGEDLREVDRAALDLARGRVLDAGAGVGGVALTLQEAGVPVTALEVVPEGVAIMKDRGVLDPICGSLETLSSREGFDTVLLLMNGTALAGTLAGMPRLLKDLDRLLAPGGQVLVDSTDLLWEEEGKEILPSPDDPDPYPGEVHYQMEFGGKRGAPFPQLFLDPGTLTRVARQEGWEVEVVLWGEEGEYLARLTRAQGHP